MTASSGGGKKYKQIYYEEEKRYAVYTLFIANTWTIHFTNCALSKNVRTTALLTFGCKYVK